MRLGLSLCVPHSCPCGEQVDAQGLYATVCKKAPGRIARHQVLNDIIWRSMGSAGISLPSIKEPSGLVRQDGKRPDGLALFPWQGGKSLTWDVTVVSQYLGSILRWQGGNQTGGGSRNGGWAEVGKVLQPGIWFYLSAYCCWESGCLQLVNFGVPEWSRSQALQFLWWGASVITHHFLFQRLSVSLQRFNSVLLHDTFVIDNVPD